MEPLFIDLNDMGVFGVFDEASAYELFSVINKVNVSAEPDL